MLATRPAHLRYCPCEIIPNSNHSQSYNQGGATWVGNVVPACLQCQIAKGGLLPQEVEAIPQEIIERIARYLQIGRDRKPLIRSESLAGWTAPDAL